MAVVMGPVMTTVSWCGRTGGVRADCGSAYAYGAFNTGGARDECNACRASRLRGNGGGEILQR